MDPRHHPPLGRIPGVPAPSRADARMVRQAHVLKGELAMTTALEPGLTTYRWSSDDPADRFSVEDPATGEVITIVQGAGAAELNAAVEAAHRAFNADWRWRTSTEHGALLLKCAEVLEAHTGTSLRSFNRRERKARSGDARAGTTSIFCSTSSASSAASSTSCRPTSTTRARYTRRRTTSPLASLVRSSRSTGRRSTPAARSRPLSPPATPSS